MKTRLIKGVEVHRGSENVFADLGLADAEMLKVNTGLAIEVRRAIKNGGLTQQEVAMLLCITQAKVSNIMHGNDTNLSVRKVMDCLSKLCNK